MFVFVTILAVLLTVGEGFFVSLPGNQQKNSVLSAKKGTTELTRPGKPKQAVFIDIDKHNVASDSWKLAPAIEALRLGGVGVIPTDTCYVFACDLHSRKGVDTIFALKRYVGKRKPLSLLCKDISTISHHTSGIDKELFKAMKKALPGPYTFILTATHEVPRVLLEHKKHRKTWKRREIGVRIPNNPVLLELLNSLDSPLLCSSVPTSTFVLEDDESLNEDEETDQDMLDNDSNMNSDTWSSSATAQLLEDPGRIMDVWGHAVDFVVGAGKIPAIGVSTVIDAMTVPPKVIRRGLGDPSIMGL